MKTLLCSVRNHISKFLLEVARRSATDIGWSDMLHDLGAPNMLAGLRLLRDRGVAPRAVIDGGACVGHWTTLFKSVFPEAAILMIEPQEQHTRTLQRLCERYAPTVQFANALIGPSDANDVAFVVLDDTSGGTGSSVLPENSDVPRHVVRLPMITLDNLLDKVGFPFPDFIKLDVQGYELEVLKGATKALTMAEFILLEVSIWQYNTSSPLLNEVLSWMDSNGFKAYEIFDLSRRPDGVLVQVDILFVRKDSLLIRENTTLFSTRRGT